MGAGAVKGTGRARGIQRERGGPGAEGREVQGRENPWEGWTGEEEPGEGNQTERVSRGRVDPGKRCQRRSEGGS